MTQEEFLELLGKGQPDADKDLIAAVEKVLNEGVPSDNIKHTDTIDTLADAYDVIEHHGIIGQRKGVRNGPPYPLSRKQLSSAEVAGMKKEKKEETTKKKPKLRKEDKAKNVIKNMDDMSVKEIEEWVKRIELEAKLEEMSKEDKKKGESYVKKILEKTGDALLTRAVPVVTMYALSKAFEKFGSDELATAFAKKM